jgi:hypothetical protein
MRHCSSRRVGGCLLDGRTIQRAMISAETRSKRTPGTSTQEAQTRIAASFIEMSRAGVAAERIVAGRVRSGEARHRDEVRG